MTGKSQDSKWVMQSLILTLSGPEEVKGLCNERVFQEEGKKKGKESGTQ